MIFLVARLIPSFLGVAVAAVLTRLLAPAEYGLYALGLSIIFFITLGIFEWLGLSVLRMAPATKQPDLFFGTVMTCFGALFGLCAIVVGVLLILGGLGSYAALATASLIAAFASAWVELKQRLQMAELRATDYFRTSVARGLITTALVAAAAYAWRSPPLVLLALAAAVFLSGLIVREPRLTFLKCRFDLTICRTLFRFGLPLSISVGLGTILMSVDKWLLQALSGPHAVGLFTAATLVAQVPVMALANGIGPSAYSMAVQALELRSAEAAKVQLAQNFTVLFGILVPSAAGIIALSANLAHLMVGPAYWQSAVSLAPWLSGAAVLMTMRAFYVDVAFQLAHRTSLLIWSNLLAVAVNVALDIRLIPLLGELGAAIGSFSALFVSLAVAAIVSRRVFRLPVPFADSAKILASAAIMFAVLHKLAPLPGPLVLAYQVAAGSLVYAVLIVTLNVMNARTRLTQYLPYVRRRVLPTR